MCPGILDTTRGHRAEKGTHPLSHLRAVPVKLILQMHRALSVREHGGIFSRSTTPPLRHKLTVPYILPGPASGKAGNGTCV